MTLSTTFRDAMIYAAELHRNQLRKGSTTPYIAHLLAVASLVLEHGGTEVEAIAALLHDSIEDQGRDGETHIEIETRFGPGVLDIVEGCTDDVPGLPRGKGSWRPRKETYLKHLAGASPSMLLVCAADKLHNARSVLADLRVHGDQLWLRFNAGKADQLWNFRALVRALDQEPGSEGYKSLVGELDRTVTEIEHLAEKKQKEVTYG